MVLYYAKRAKEEGPCKDSTDKIQRERKNGSSNIRKRFVMADSD